MWQTVPICEDCWAREEGERVPIRVNTPSLYYITLDLEICYNCKKGTRGGIFVRREVSNASSSIQSRSANGDAGMAGEST